MARAFGTRFFFKQDLQDVQDYFASAAQGLTGWRAAGARADEQDFYLRRATRRPIALPRTAVKNLLPTSAAG